MNPELSHAAALVEVRRITAERDRLFAALQDVFSLIDEQWLVRNIERDGEPGFALRQLEPTMKLAKARALLDRIEKGKA